MNNNKNEIPCNISKIALFTDIHFGAKSNSNMHNQDCVDFIDWFAENVKKDKTIDAIGFLGDWNENRSALNISTLNYSYRGAKAINDLGLPVFFIIGNHDLYHRHTREVHSVIPFNEFDNFAIIEEPTILKNTLGDDLLMCPYMFHEEYPSLSKYHNIPVWLGHFEFKGFEVTGNGMKMPTGPEAKTFGKQKYIMSGHFHKRQAHEGSNVVYIGNTFPTNFGDAGDINRGMAIYDVVNSDLIFENWAECPKYTKTTLSDILDGSCELLKNARVKCIVDIPISFEESSALKQSFTEKYKLREFILEESFEIKRAMEDTETSIDWENNKLAGVDELVHQMLNEIDSDHIDNDMLTQIYSELKTEH